MRKFMFFMSVFLIAGTLFGVNSIHADWANRFAVNDGKSYIISDTKVETSQIGGKIGKVTSFSDEEGTYSGNFSNTYPKGTEYYAINDIDTNEAIAIKVSEDSFIKAAYGGEYAGNAFSMKKMLLYAGGIFLIIIVILFVRNNWRRNSTNKSS